MRESVKIKVANSERAGVIMEFILVLPILLVAVLMLFDLGLRQYYRTVFGAAAERAVSYAAVAPHLESVDIDNLASEAVIIEIQERALELLTTSGVPVHLGAWVGGENYRDENNGSPPDWAWVNDIQVILPEDPDGNKTLSEMLISEPIIFELEGFYARTFTGLGPARFALRRATFREQSQTPSNPLAADAERPCPGAIDNRYGFSNGECYCRLDGSGLTDEAGGCECAEQKQTYDETLGKCLCPGAPVNTEMDPDTCDVTCIDEWEDKDGDGSCEHCPEPYTQADPLSGTCSCSESERDACYSIPGTFDPETCECQPCPGSSGNEDRFVTDGSCGCKPAGELCSDDRMSVQPGDGCSCTCPNEFFDLTGDEGSETCECDTARLAEICEDGEYTNTDSCTCTNCEQSGANRDAEDPKTCLCSPCEGGTFKAGEDLATECAECITCDSERFEGEFEANPGYDPEVGGNPCVCNLTCEGEDEFLDSENEGAAGGRCECRSCEGQADANEDNDGCFCDKATLYNECVTLLGPDGQLEFDPNTSVCDCGAPCPADFVVNVDTGVCECPQSKVDGTTCPDGETFSDSVCRCIAICDGDRDTDDYDPNDPSSCSCDADAVRQGCHDNNMPFNAASCACDGNCSDINSGLPHWDETNNTCFCDKAKYIDENALDCNGKVFNQDSCSCGTASCTGATPDYSPDGHECVCDMASKEESCRTADPPLEWDVAICDCGSPCSESEPDYDSDAMTCSCSLARKDACIDTGFAWDNTNCTCGGNCEEESGANDVNDNGECYCNRNKNIEACEDLDPPQATGSDCGCGGICGGATPDLVDGNCTCDRNWANGDGDGASCEEDQYFNPDECLCKSCGENATPGSNANRDCVCTNIDCPPGMDAYPDTATECECSCPSGHVELPEGFSPDNRCMPQTEECQQIGDCFWNGTEWVPTGTE
jgi:hypothetical protein